MIHPGAGEGRALDPAYALFLESKYFASEGECFIRMTGLTRGNLFLILFLVLTIFSLSMPGCLGRQDGAKVSPAQDTGRTATTPPPVPTLPPTMQTPRPEPIVGTWYAPIPDDLTFEFHADGTFIERSPNFRTYGGTWTTSDENHYDAFILDRWGYGKPGKSSLQQEAS
jgi:hypothetical protein